MSIVGTAFKSVGSLLGYLVVADIAGVVLGAILDVLPLRAVSPPLFYAIWLVLGVLSGLFAYNLAGLWSSSGKWPTGLGSRPEDWTARSDARRTGNVILVTCISVLAVLTLSFYRFWWSQGVNGEYYVPNSMTHTIVFLLSVLAGLILARTMLMPEQSGRAP
jgi:hypothetical protein